MGVIGGLIRGGLIAAGGQAEGANAGEAESHRRQMVMEQLARQQAEQEARLDMDKQHLLLESQRDSTSAAQWQKKFDADQANAERTAKSLADYRTQEIQDRQTQEAETARHDKADEANARTLAAERYKHTPPTRQAYLAKRVPEILKEKPDKLDDVALALGQKPTPKPTLQEAVQRAGQEYDSIYGPQTGPPAPQQQTTTDPSSLMALHGQAAAAIKAGADPHAIMTELHNQTMKLTGSPVFNAAPPIAAAPKPPPAPALPSAPGAAQAAAPPPGMPAPQAKPLMLPKTQGDSLVDEYQADAGPAD